MRVLAVLVGAIVRWAQRSVRALAASAKPARHLRGLLQAAQDLQALAPAEPRRLQPGERSGMTTGTFRAELARARTQVQLAENLVVSAAAEMPDALTAADAETYLWNALSTYLRLGQVAALSGLQA